MKKIKARIGITGAEMSGDGTKWKVNTPLFGDNTVLLAQEEKDLQKLLN